MDIYLFNSLTNHTEKFEPLREGKVSMYICGPTVYDFVHIGNLRPVVVFDVLRRFLTYLGYEVTFVSNYTDVDDKIIDKAQKTGKSEREITDFFIHEFEKDVRDIHSLPPTYTPRVSECMDDMIAFIDALLKNQAAYEVDGDVYFRITSDPRYGELSNTNIEQLQVGARIDENTKKENPLDFTLWKKTDVGVKWDSPWSKGRPGWHTECVVMINSLFPEGKIDIHGGGFDLKFPHHENEIAQSMAYHHHHIARYWLHNGFINVQSEKMSKSLGNVVTAHDALAQYGGNTVRMLLLSTHYRSPVNYGDELLQSNAKEILKLQTVYRQIDVKLQWENRSTEAGAAPHMDAFLTALADDLNTANAISELFRVAKEGNRLLRSREVDLDLLEGVYFSLKAMIDILGLVFDSPRMTSEDRTLYARYLAAKEAQDFATSDEIRQTLVERHIL